MRLYTTITLLSIIFSQLCGQLQNPDQFLHQPWGQAFTGHHIVVDYFEHVAAESPLVKLIPYGKTNQGRPLFVAIVTSEDNMAKIDEIRLNNLRRAGIETGNVNDDQNVAIVWLSFSVHGNEAAGTESSYRVLYDLVDPQNTKTKQWLENTVVIIDPSVNPDGYARYTNWARDIAMSQVNQDINDAEHHEPWPGGRVNHYLFDLNRDWAWQTQVESKQRMVLYNQWLPHVHADIHEMGHNSHYYFAPASRPYHNFITQWQRDFQDSIGRNHAKYFDEQGWLYFTREVFDLFYPSYGDTYPIYSGSIGMTYEQAGGPRGGRAISTDNGEVLTLKDRVEHHYTTALSTVEISSLKVDQLIAEFSEFYRSTSTDPVGEYDSYVMKKDHSGQRIAALAKLLEAQGIKYGTVSQKRKVKGYDYNTGKIVSYEVEPGDLIVSVYQPKSVMTQVLLDPVHQIEDSLTYDITAWSLPLAYGLQAYANHHKLEPSTLLKATVPNQEVSDESYAYLIPWTDLESVKAAAWLSKKGLAYRYATKTLYFKGKNFDPGTLVVSRADNQSKVNSLSAMMRELGAEINCSITAVTSGYAGKGPDLGSGSNQLVENPKVLTIMGEGVYNYDFGAVKWYFDQVIHYPMSMVHADRLSAIDLSEYNVIILPNGYNYIHNLDKLAQWVARGGKLIAIEYATRQFVDNESFSLTNYATDKDEALANEQRQQAELAARYHHYGDHERQSISHYVPGAIFKLNIDNTHPLAYGLGDHYFSLRTNSLHYPLLPGVQNVISHPKKDGRVLGFAGAKIKKQLEDSVAFAVENNGRGTVVYMTDDPLFRGFWYNGLFLFGNALFLVQ